MQRVSAIESWRRERDCKWSHSPFGVHAMMYALHSVQYWSFRNNCHFQNGAIEIDSWYFIVSTHKMHREQSHQIHLYINVNWFGLHAWHSIVCDSFMRFSYGEEQRAHPTKNTLSLFKRKYVFVFRFQWIRSLLIRLRTLVNLLTCPFSLDAIVSWWHS